MASEQGLGEVSPCARGLEAGWIGHMADLSTTYLLVLVCARQILHRWRKMLASSFKIFETVTLYAKKSLVSGQLGRCASPWTHLEV